MIDGGRKIMLSRDNTILINAFKETYNFRNTCYVGVSCSTCVRTKTKGLLCMASDLDSSFKLSRSMFRVCDLHKEE